MESIASAPGKTILFGEHSVVYDEPAIAAAINKRATVKIKPSKNNKTILKSDDLGFKAELNTKQKKYTLIKGKPGIIRYILEALSKVHDHQPIEINLSTNIPIGLGLGSSAAVTVATLASLYRYHQIKFTKKSLANDAHEVELSVQGAASPLDTLVCTYGGFVYLSRNKKIDIFKNNFNSSFVLAYTSKYGSTGKMVKGVKLLKDKQPVVMDSIVKTMGLLADEAKKAILDNDVNKIGELMNINHGLLDSIGVSTIELSRMVYLARNNGAIGSKITGAGGGGSILSLCPGKTQKVETALNKQFNAIPVKFSKKGISSKVNNNENPKKGIKINKANVNKSKKPNNISNSGNVLKNQKRIYGKKISNSISAKKDYSN